MATMEYKLPGNQRVFIYCRHFKDLTFFYGSDKDLRNANPDKPDADFSATHQGYSIGAGIMFQINKDRT